MVSKLFESIDKNDYEAAAAYLHDDLKLTGPFAEPQTKNMWIGCMKGMLSAFPDWNFNASEIEGSAEAGVKFNVQIIATYKGDLMIPDGPTVPATNKSVSMPREPGTATFKDGKILEMKMTAGPDAVIGGILEQIGFEPPGH